MKYIFLLFILTVKILFSNDLKTDFCKSSPPFKNISAEKLSESHKTIFGLTIGKNNFEDLKKYFGEIVPFKRDPTCVSCPKEACYVSKNKEIAIVFYKYNSWDFYQFIITEDPQKTDEKHCVKTDKVDNSIETKSGLKIGMTHQEISKILTAPVYSKPYKKKYFFHKQLKLSPKRLQKSIQQDLQNNIPINCKNYYYDVVGDIIFLFNERGLVKELSVSYTESY
ncbi:MAG: hypothetical protein OIF32_01240 [Campylobacterales bacterium]|nr:hypothetical protein [Campylobacterales bacterium]